MAMERKKKAATESGALVLIIALILVARERAQLLHVLPQGHDERRALHAVRQGSGRLLQSMKE